jgi:hypothetical protein
VASVFAPSFPDPGSGGSQNLTGDADADDYTMGTHVRPLVAGTVTAIRYYVPTGHQPTNAAFGVGLYKVDPTAGVASPIVLAWQSATPPTAGQAGTWVTYTLASPVTVAAGDELYPTVRTNRYAYSTHVFDAGSFTVGNLAVPADSSTFPNGAFTTGSGVTSVTPPANPATSFNATFYGVDLDFTVSGGSTLALAGAATSTSSATGALSSIQAVGGAATSTSSASGTLTTRSALTGAAASSSTATAALTGTLALSGAAAGTSSAAGTLTARQVLIGAAVGTSAAAGVLGLNTTLGTGAAASTSTALGQLGLLGLVTPGRLRPGVRARARLGPSSRIGGPR